MSTTIVKALNTPPAGEIDEEKLEDQTNKYDSPKVLLKPLYFLLAAVGALVLLKALLSYFQT